MIDSDDEQFAKYGAQLHQAVVAAAPGWVDRVLTPLVGAKESDGRSAAVAATLDEIDRRLSILAATDADIAMSGPLELIRQSTTPLQEWLHAHGVPEPVRDPWDVRASPDDRYALGPMAFTDISEAVHDAGIAWGAAKAHMHLRRRSQRPPDASA